MNNLIAALFLVLFALSNGYKFNSNNWENFKQTFGKSYSPSEELNRRQIFEENLAKIIKHNIEYEQGLTSYKLGINSFSDMTEEEFKNNRFGFKKHEKLGYDDDLELITFDEPDVDTPDEVDWRAKGGVTPVKNMGMCGATWAFTAVGSLEGQYFRKTGNLIPLSELNIAECSVENSSGCSGGNILDGFKYVHNNDGIDSASGYPDSTDTTCKYDAKNNVTSMTNQVLVIKEGSEAALKVAIAKLGPVAVAIDASNLSFQMYVGGIYYNQDCTTSLNHSVLVVGYGTEDGQDYWVVKNSWGESWGEDGYIRMARNMDNNCGIASYALLPVLYE